MLKKIEGRISKENEMRLFIGVSSAVATWFVVTMINGYLSGACAV